MLKIQNYINGKFSPAASGKYLDNYNPATGEIYSLIPDSDAVDVEEAVSAASQAFPAWSNTSPEKRHDVLLRLVHLIERDMDKLAEAESIDSGKPLTLSRRVDIPRAALNFKFYATGIMHLASEAHETSASVLNYTLRHPVGVAGCISPWNLPLYLFSWKVAPALAAGCSVVAKPSEITPMTAYMLSQLCAEAGIPHGVFNIVHGAGNRAGTAIISHPQVKAISFTGGTKTGAEISRIAAPMFKKLSLELGGKNPNIIFADCNYEEMMKITLLSSFSNQGQICLCGSRIFVERSLYDRFREDFVNRTKSLITDDPLNIKADLGAVVSKQHFDKIMSYIKIAEEEGGKILCGGKQKIVEGRCKNGWFIEPTVIEGLPYDCRTNQEEIFGPVVTIMPFYTEEEVLRYANSSAYGLSSTIWTENLRRAHRVAAQIEAGIVWVNTWLNRDLRTPFGGVKQSGIGREGGFEALRFFTEEKNVCIKHG